MADVNVTDLTQETYSTLDGTEQVIMFDSAEGKRATVAAVGEYVLKKLTTSLNGSTQTVANALASLNSDLHAGFDTSSYTTWADVVTSAPLGVTVSSASHFNSALRPESSVTDGWGAVIIMKKSTLRFGVLWIAGSNTNQSVYTGHYNTGTNNMVWNKLPTSILS